MKQLCSALGILLYLGAFGVETARGEWTLQYDSSSKLFYLLNEESQFDTQEDAKKKPFPKYIHSSEQKASDTNLHLSSKKRRIPPCFFNSREEAIAKMRQLNQAESAEEVVVAPEAAKEEVKESADAIHRISDATQTTAAALSGNISICSNAPVHSVAAQALATSDEKINVHSPSPARILQDKKSQLANYKTKYRAILNPSIEPYKSFLEAQRKVQIAKKNEKSAFLVAKRAKNAAEQNSTVVSKSVAKTAMAAYKAAQKRTDAAKIELESTLSPTQNISLKTLEIIKTYRALLDEVNRAKAKAKQNSPITATVAQGPVLDHKEPNNPFEGGDETGAIDHENLERKKILGKMWQIIEPDDSTEQKDMSDQLSPNTKDEGQKHKIEASERATHSTNYINFTGFLAPYNTTQLEEIYKEILTQHSGKINYSNFFDILSHHPERDPERLKILREIDKLSPFGPSHSSAFVNHITLFRSTRATLSQAQLERDLESLKKKTSKLFENRRQQLERRGSHHIGVGGGTAISDPRPKDQKNKGNLKDIRDQHEKALSPEGL